MRRTQGVYSNSSAAVCHLVPLQLAQHHARTSDASSRCQWLSLAIKVVTLVIGDQLV